MSNERQISPRISTARFAKLLADYERLGRSISVIQKRHRAFAEKPAEEELPTEVASVEEYHHRSTESRHIQHGRNEQLHNAASELDGARCLRALVLEGMVDEGLFEDVWIEDPLHGAPWYVLLERDGEGEPVLRRARKDQLRRGRRMGLSPARIEANGAYLAWRPLHMPLFALRALAGLVFFFCAFAGCIPAAESVGPWLITALDPAGELPPFSLVDFWRGVPLMWWIALAAGGFTELCEQVGKWLTGYTEDEREIGTAKELDEGGKL